MFVYLQKLLHCLIKYIHTRQIHSFHHVHENNDQSDLAILINKIKMIDDAVSNKSMLYVYKDLNMLIHVR